MTCESDSYKQITSLCLDWKNVRKKKKKKIYRTHIVKFVKGRITYDHAKFTFSE